MSISFPDNKLIADLKQHKAATFSEMYDKYAPALFGDIKRTLYRQDVSEETLQHVFNFIWQNIDSYNPEKERFFSWALRIAKTQARRQKINLALKDVFGY